MRILRLVSENVKRIVLVDLRPIADVVTITGKNGAGKSSLLDSVQYLFGGLRVIPSSPVREGAEEMNIMAELGAGETVELRVKRVMSADGENQRLVVESAKGARHDAPQRMLDAMRTSLSFDPYEFSRMSAKDQLETLRKMVPLEIDLNEFDGETLRIEETRTGVGREARALRARVDAYVVGPDWPTEKVDVQALLNEAEAINDHNMGVSQDGVTRRGQLNDADRMHREGVTKHLQAAELRAQAERLESDADALQAQADAIATAVRALPIIPPPIDPVPLRGRIMAAEMANDKYRLRVEAQILETNCVKKEEEYESLTDAIESRRGYRTGVIARAQMPVDGLGFGEGEVTFGGKPLEQASDAEKLRVSLGIAMAQNGKLRVILIKNGEKCDSASMEIIKEMAAARDYQVLMERVDESGKSGVYLEEGVVKSFDADMATALV